MITAFSAGVTHTLLAGTRATESLGLRRTRYLSRLARALPSRRIRLLNCRSTLAATGVVLNPNFETYKLPGAADIPDIEIVLQDMPERGVIGIGEPVTIPTAAAIANAISNAIGKRINNLPISPAQILGLLGKVPGVPVEERNGETGA